MNYLSYVEQYMRTADYLGMNIKTSTNKQDKINAERTVSKYESSKDYARRTQQGRNEPCNCGSGLKFKKCCGKIVNKED